MPSYFKESGLVLFKESGVAAMDANCCCGGDGGDPTGCCTNNNETPTLAELSGWGGELAFANGIYSMSHVDVESTDCFWEYDALIDGYDDPANFVYQYGPYGLLNNFYDRLVRESITIQAAKFNSNVTSPFVLLTAHVSLGLWVSSDSGSTYNQFGSVGGVNRYDTYDACGFADMVFRYGNYNGYFDNVRGSGSGPGATVGTTSLSWLTN